MDNQLNVLETIHKHGPISRADIAAMVRLSPAAVTNITGNLIARTLVYESRKAKSDTVGRKAILLEVDYEHALVAGIKLANENLTFALTNLNGDIAQIVQKPLRSLEPVKVSTVISSIVKDLELETSTKLAALGVSLPGIVANDRRTIRHSPMLGWEQIAFGDMLSESLGLPVLVENDVNAFAFAKAWLGNKTQDNFMVVTLGRGVGLGIIMNGEIYRGPSGGAGEFGHIILDPNGPETQHANRGSIEAYLSDDALCRAAKTAKPDLKHTTVEEITQLALQGDDALLKVFDSAGDVLGRALSILVNIFAPPVIVLGGEGMRAADLLLPAALRSLDQHCFGDLASKVSLSVDAWGDDAWARGAAGLAANYYLTDAVLTKGGG